MKKSARIISTPLIVAMISVYLVQRIYLCRKWIHVVLITVILCSLISSNVKLVYAKNFKGNLNATYKSTDGLSNKIRIKGKKSGKISITVTAGVPCSAIGKIISPNTIRVKFFDSSVILKWKDKTHFVAKPVSGDFLSGEWDNVYWLCDSLNNKKYVQIKAKK